MKEILSSHIKLRDDSFPLCAFVYALLLFSMLLCCVCVSVRRWDANAFARAPARPARLLSGAGGVALDTNSVTDDNFVYNCEYFTLDIIIIGYRSFEWGGARTQTTSAT